MNTNNITLIKIINNIVKREAVPHFNCQSGSLKNMKTDFIPKTREDDLALEIAEALNDHKSLGFYIKQARFYPENLLRMILGEVMEIPPDKIKKSKGALFNHLLKKYAKQTKNNYRY